MSSDVGIVVLVIAMQVRIRITIGPDWMIHDIVIEDIYLFSIQHKSRVQIYSRSSSGAFFKPCEIRQLGGPEHCSRLLHSAHAQPHAVYKKL